MEKGSARPTLRIDPPVIQSLGMQGEHYRLKVSFPVHYITKEEDSGLCEQELVDAGSRSIILEMRAEDLPQVAPGNETLVCDVGRHLRDKFGGQSFTDGEYGPSLHSTRGIDPSEVQDASMHSITAGTATCGEIGRSLGGLTAQKISALTIRNRIPHSGEVVYNDGAGQLTKPARTFNLEGWEQIRRAATQEGLIPKNTYSPPSTLIDADQVWDQALERG
jgi:hypothetical protein